MYQVEIDESDPEVEHHEEVHYHGDEDAADMKNFVNRSVPHQGYLPTAVHDLCTLINEKVLSQLPLSTIQQLPSVRWVKIKMWRHRTLLRVVVFLVALLFALLNWWLLKDFHKAENDMPQGTVQKKAESEGDHRLKYLGKNLIVEYEIVSNMVSQWSYHGRIYLRNGGTEYIPAGSGWELYFNHIRFLEESSLKSEGSISVANLQMSLTHINGNLFRLSPTEEFTGLAPGYAIVISYHGAGFVLTRWEVLPNWYVTAKGFKPQLVESTVDVEKFVMPQLTEAQWKSSKVDRHNPFTPEVRYMNYEIEDMKKAPHMVLPTPVQMSVTEKHTIPMAHSWVVASDARAKHKAQFLAKKMHVKYVDTPPENTFIWLALGDVDLTLPNEENLHMKEAYKISVDRQAAKVSILAKTEAGLFNGVQSFLSLMSDRNEVPIVEIIDAPRFAHRGVMLDVARNFFAKEEIMRIIDVLAMYKLNKLHLHLTDDEGWRLQIPGLPQLTEIGGCRAHGEVETEHILAGLGSGPHAEGFGCGYYTVEDYKDILRYADDRHIEIIPEIDMPGHSHAAIKAMEARHRELLRSNGVTKASEFLLSDLNDQSKYYSVQGFKDNVINPCLESTYHFIEHVMSNLVNMHEGIQPLRGFHFGADEIPTASLSNSPVCKQLQKAHPKMKSHFDYYSYFVKKVTALAKKYKVTLYGWMDAFYGHVDKQYVPLPHDESAEFVAMAWQNRWDWGRAHRAYEQANNGYKVVLAPSTILYFDHPQEPDPEELGLVWASRYTTTKKVFEFLPDNFFENIDAEFTGKTLDPDIACQTMVNCLELTSPENIIGIQAAVWTELIRTVDQLHHQMFPRVLALAERAWHEAPWEQEEDRKKMRSKRQQDWEQFANTLGYKELPRLDELGIAYFLPPPGAKFEDKQLKVNNGFPGLDLQFRPSEGGSWENLHSHARVPASIEIATRSFNGKRRSRPIKMDLTVE